MNIQFNQVFKSYNGKSGCMCGCRGNYSVSDRSVRIAVKKVNAALNFVGPHPRHVEIGYDDDCAFYDDGKRNTVVYFRDPINKKKD